MTTPLDTIKPAVRQLCAYALAPEHCAVKLNQNESPWDAPDRLKRETLARLRDQAWSRYPEFVPTHLLARLADFSGWTSDGVLAGNGSNELIFATFAVTLGPGRRLLVSEPTFALYRQVATILGCDVTS